MLRSFRLQNHRSFRGEAELSLLPSYQTERPAVPIAAIYGANAAGKSSLLDGLRFMSRAVMESYRRWEPEGGVPRSPFRFDPAGLTSPSSFVVDLEVEGVRYVYGFAVDDERVLEEWLYGYPRGKKRVIFERQGSAVEFGSTVSEPRSRSEVLAELTRPNALFLSLAAQVGMVELTPVREWFVSGLRWGGSRLGLVPRSVSLVQALLASPSDNEALVGLVRAADVGITDVFVDTDEKALLQSQGEARQRLATAEDALAAAPQDPDDAMTERLHQAVQRASRDLESLASDRAPRRLRFVHGAAADPFDFADESAGTQAWVSLLPAVLRSLRQASTLVIDEIDTSLHPHLTAHLVSLFQAEQTNPHGAQLIFTTHDASLLGTTFGEEVLARDQVWFVEKDTSGNSSLYPLTDFHPRKDENRERRYLGGSYGAVPVLGAAASGAEPVQRGVAPGRTHHHAGLKGRRAR
jgi:predicted ATPase